MHVVHQPADGEPRTLATEVEIADTTLARARGLMFRRSLPDGSALVFRFDGVETRFVHMLFVPFPIEVLWLDGGEVARATTLRPWIGLDAASADTLVELPAGVANEVEVGDRIRVA